MWDYLRAVLGEVTIREVVLVAIIYVCIVAYTWAPRIGGAIGGLFDEDRE